MFFHEGRIEIEGYFNNFENFQISVKHIRKSCNGIYLRKIIIRMFDTLYAM